MNFSIKQILPHVYHLHFEEQYDLAMHFIRFQEYYESPKFHKKLFTMAEYMRWYSKEYGKGAFTYPKDWSGFNVPSWALLDVRKGLPNFEWREEDIFMHSLIDKVRAVEGEHPFYFIGTSENSAKKNGHDVLRHELAHALYTVDLGYKNRVDDLFQQWFHVNWDSFPAAAKQMADAEASLRQMGYHDSTVRDELHAYCATGLCEELEGVVPIERTLPFQALLNETLGKLETPK